MKFAKAFSAIEGNFSCIYFCFTLLFPSIKQFSSLMLMHITQESLLSNYIKAICIRYFLLVSNKKLHLVNSSSRP